MPTPARITDLLARDDNDRLLKELVRPESPLPLSTRLILSEEGGLSVVCRSLSLVRLVDAGYRPSRAAIGLATRVVEDARAGLDAAFRDDADDAAWARLAAQLVALEAWRTRMALLSKLGVTPDLPAPLKEVDVIADRLIDAAASWLHAQLAQGDPLEATPGRVTLLWLLSERIPGALAEPLDRLGQRLHDAGAAHDRCLGELFVGASRRRERRRTAAPAPIGAAA